MQSFWEEKRTEIENYLFIWYDTYVCVVATIFTTQSSFTKFRNISMTYLKLEIKFTEKEI